MTKYAKAIDANVSFNATTILKNVKRFALEKNYTVLAGLNLAMLIEAEMQRGMLKGDELEEDLMNAAKDGVRNIRKIMKERKGL